MCKLQPACSACGVIYGASTVIHACKFDFDRLRPSAVTAKYELAVIDGPKLTVTVPDKFQTARLPVIVTVWTGHGYH